MRCWASAVPTTWSISSGSTATRAASQGLRETKRGCSADRLRIRFRAKIHNKLLQRPRAQIALRAVPHRHGARFCFLPADDEHVVDLLDLRVADFRLQLLIPVVEMHSQARRLEFFGYFLRVFTEFSAYRQHSRLHRREP